jgi:hypothetical protein
MSEEHGIGIGFNEDMIDHILQELCIRTERKIPLMEFLQECVTECQNQDPINVLQKIVAHTTKANELTFLCFMYGISIGGVSATTQFMSKMPRIIDKAARIGAQAAMEGNLPPELAAEAAANGTTPPAAKKKNPDDIMYG